MYKNLDPVMLWGDSAPWISGLRQVSSSGAVLDQKLESFKQHRGSTCNAR